VLDLRDALDGLDKHLPAVPLGSENLSPLACQAVIPSSPLPALLHPSALQPAPLFQAIEQRIERGHVEAQSAAGALLDEFADFIAVARPSFQQGKDQ